MSELLRELEEDMRAERLQSLWVRFGRSMVWISVAVVFGTAAGVLWKQYRHSEQAEQTGAILHGMQSFAEGKYADTIKNLEPLAARATDAYARIALLHTARAYQESGDKDAAAKTYKTLTTHTSAEGDQVFIDLANLESSVISGAPIVTSKDSPFYYTLTEWSAWQLVKASKKDEAAKLFLALADDDRAPQSMRERVTLALHYLAPAGKSDAQ